MMPVLAKGGGRLPAPHLLGIGHAQPPGAEGPPSNPPLPAVPPAAGAQPLSEGFVAWRAYVARTPDLPCGKLMSRTCPHLTPQEAAAYDAPFPDARYKAGARRFPQLVAEHREDPGADIARKARQWLSDTWRGESFMAIGVRDPVLGLPVMTELRKWIRGCPEPYRVENGGHFLQEWGDEVAAAALKHWS